MLKIRGRGDEVIVATIELQRQCPTCGTKLDEALPDAVVSRSTDTVDGDWVSFRVGDRHMGGVVVELAYDSRETGTWRTVIGQILEGVPIPWSVSIKGCDDNKDSVVVEVDCPEGTPVHISRPS